MSKSIPKMTYKEAGVDIEKAEKALQDLKQRISRTYTPEVLSGVGLFGGFYDLSRHGLQQPVLVSSTDGVGTKLKVAMMAGRHDTIGQDLVNHCINDIAVCGASPLFFLDYFASGNLQAGVYEAVITGITRACRDAGIPLIGGETAEMPDFYRPGEYDLSGTIVGIVEKSNIIDGRFIEPQDLLIGLSSNGLHTNGYTLARKVLLERYALDDLPPELDAPLVDELLRIHPNYFPLIQQLCRHAPVKGIAHITGGGIFKNTRRLLSDHLTLKIDWGSWPIPPVFELIRKTGNVPLRDMRQTFNMGIGLVFIVAPQYESAILDFAGEFEYHFYPIGRVNGG